MDTRLAQPLSPGDTQVVLESASSWHAGGAWYSRSLAWYGYQDSTGHTYADYSYTRNVLLDAWDAGAINGNVITLRAPWSGPALAAGTAVRNATSGGTYNYAVLSNASVPDQWARYAATIEGVQQNGQESSGKFRPGTAYIKPLLLQNYHGQADNRITWRHVAWNYAGSEPFHAGDRVELQVAPVFTGPPTYSWTQTAGPAVVL